MARKDPLVQEAPHDLFSTPTSFKKKDWRSANWRNSTRREEQPHHRSAALQIIQRIKSSNKRRRKSQITLSAAHCDHRRRNHRQTCTIGTKRWATYSHIWGTLPDCHLPVPEWKASSRSAQLSTSRNRALTSQDSRQLLVTRS